MQLQALHDTLAVCRLKSDAEVVVPAGTDFYSVTRTADEVSVVCRESQTPVGATVEGGWRGLRVAGAIPFETIGVLAALTTAAKDAGISVFAFSTFDTDYLLAKAADWDRLVQALLAAGWEFTD